MPSLRWFILNLLPIFFIANCQISPGIYTIQNKQTGLYMYQNTYEGSHPGNRVAARDNAAGIDAHWHVATTSNGEISLQNSISGFFLNEDITGGTRDGNPIQVWSDDLAPESKWDLVSLSTGDISIININSKLNIVQTRDQQFVASNTSGVSTWIFTRIGPTFSCSQGSVPICMANQTSGQYVTDTCDKKCNPVPPPIPEITIHVNHTQTPFPHFWERSFGSGHAALGLRDDWRAHLTRCVHDLGMKGVRFHGLFDDDMGPVVQGTQDAVVYNWTLVDSIFDFLHGLNVRPVVELSFMPCVLAGCCQGGCTYQFHYKGVAQPPQNDNWSLWYELVLSLTKHLTQRYGENEVAQWYFEVWNEMMGKMPYPGKYMPLYNASWVAIKSVSSKYRVGGPATMELQHLKDFASRARQMGAIPDFISSHCYPIDPPCTGSTDRECFVQELFKARKEVSDFPFLITEYNPGWRYPAFRLNTDFAASFVVYNVLSPMLRDQFDMFSYWTFSDVFEEGGFPSNEWEGEGFGILTLNGIPKPAFRAFEMMHNLGTQMLSISQYPLPQDTGVRVVATGDGVSAPLQVLLTYYDHPEPNTAPPLRSTNVQVTLQGVENLSKPTVKVINSTCANSYAKWKAIGSPGKPSPSQLAILEKASKPCQSSLVLQHNGNKKITFQLSLESYAVVLVTFSPQKLKSS